MDFFKFLLIKFVMIWKEIRMDRKDYLSEINNSKPIRVVFSNPRDKGYRYKKVRINLKNQKERTFYQIESFTDKQVFHENLDTSDLLTKLDAYFALFKQVSAISEEYSFDMRESKKGKILYSRKAQKNKIEIDRSHNKKKRYILEEGMDIPAFVDLGIFTKEGKIINSKYDKYKQINRFVEIIDDEIKRVENEFSDKPLHILDFGCGKSYLTFVLYYYFKEIKNLDVRITGLDLKEDVIDKCNEIAKKYGYEDLKFELGDINGYKYTDNIDVVITLHACDTATDFALFNAISWNARMIFSVPCCQHEINSNIKSDSMRMMTKYGIVKERMSALMTDAVRANLLEVCGYKTQMLEFIDISHSPKNILIRAHKSNIPLRKIKESLEEIEDTMDVMRFNQTLYNLLKEDGRLDFDDEN